MLLERVPPRPVRAVHVGDDPEVVDEVRLPQEPDAQRQVVHQVARAVEEGPARELPPGDEEEGVELHDAVPARLDRVLGVSERVEEDEEGERVMQDDGPREPRHRGRRDDDPDRVHRDVGDEDLGDEVRVHRAEEAEDAHDRQAADERDVERIVQSVGQRALLLGLVGRRHGVF